MSNKPFSYGSLKCVLQYMEANNRFQLAQQAPSIRCAEKSTPLQIDRLFLGQTSIIVNQCIFQLGIIRKSTDGMALRLIEEINEAGGVPYDLDEFGGKDKSSDDVMMPGDLRIENVRAEIVDEEEEERIMQDMNRELVHLKRRRNEESVQDWIDQLEYKLFPWKNRRQNIRQQPYKSYIQLDTDTDVNNKPMERVEYNKKIYEAAKYLTNKFFGGRRDTVTVNYLTISTADNFVLRLPEKLKLKVTKLKIGENVASIANSLNAILDPQSFPLTMVQMSSSRHFEEAQNHGHPIIKTAKRVRFLGKPDSDEWFNIILNAREPRVIHVENGDFSKEKFISLIDKWLADGREVGTSISFAIHKKETVTNLFNLIKQRPNVRKLRTGGRRRTFRIKYILPMNDSSNYIFINSTDYAANSNGGSLDPKWFLRFVVCRDY